ncbi:hypothetical protein Bca4012_083168 [Brassica carinata]
MALSHFCYCLLPFLINWSIRGGSPRWTKRRSRGLFVSDLPVVSSLQVAFSPATSREGSLAFTVFWFSGTVLDEPPFGCHRTSCAVDFVPFFHPSLEQSFHLTISSFPSLEKTESNTTLWFALPQFSGTRSQSSMRLYPSLFSVSSIYSYRKVVLSYLAWILLNGRPVSPRRSFSGDFFYGIVKRPRFNTSFSKQVVCSGLLCIHDWVWPIRDTQPASPNLRLPRPKFLKEDELQIITVLGVWVIFEISGWSTKFSSRCIMPYFFSGMILSVGSPGLVSISPSSFWKKCLLPQFLLLTKGDVFSVLLSRYSFGFLTGLPSCVAGQKMQSRLLRFFSLVRAVSQRHL